MELGKKVLEIMSELEKQQRRARKFDLELPADDLGPLWVRKGALWVRRAA